MGTPTSTSYANLFLYGVERALVSRHKPSYYRRYIDDIFAIFDNADSADSFKSDFNSAYPTIQLDDTTQRSGKMLDLNITLKPSTSDFYGPCDRASTCLYQKPMNIYQYIPTLSEHAPHVFNSFVLQEICRIRLSCTSDQDFQHMNSLFAKRLLARGYSLQKVIDKKHAEPNTHDPPTKIIATFQAPVRTKKIPWKTILIIPPYLANHQKFKTAFPRPKLIIGTKNPPTLGSHILRSLDKG
jgi:hypothetical protein